jgi:hypothetical protein
VGSGAAGDPAEQRGLLETLLSNCRFDRGIFSVTHGKPVDVLVRGHETGEGRRERDSTPRYGFPYTGFQDDAAPAAELIKVHLRNNIMNSADCILFSGGAAGAEAEFGTCAERHGIEEVNFTFDGHQDARQRGIRVLNHEELRAGDVSLEYVSRLMNRRYTEGPTIRKVLQTLWYQVNSGQEIYVIGTILPDDTVRGGTGWGAEFAKLCNKPLHVFDQEKDSWFKWSGSAWQALSSSETPAMTHPHFTGTGTRNLQPNGRRAIQALYEGSFRESRASQRA